MTGSEDVFSAAYMAAIFQNKSIPEALTLASANACSVMEIFGTRTGILKKPALRTMKVETNIL
jgi:sugar/nucleoside kinase (ribokinase family)